MDVFIVTLYSYILGSIPFGLILTRLAGLGDVRKIGSGNIGATNVLRTGNKFIATLTLLLDGLKGTLSVFLTMQYFNELTYYSAVIVFLAHIFPVWLKFKGGKGVATFIGSLLVRLSLGVRVTGSSLDAVMSMVAHPERIVTSNNDNINFIKEF